MRKPILKFKVLSFYTFILALSTFNLLVFLSMRPFWYFINRDTKTPIFTGLPFTTLVFAIYSLFFIYSLALLLMYFIKKNARIIKPGRIILVLSPLLGALLSAFSYYLFTRMEGDQYLVLNYLSSSKPYLFIFAIIFLLIFINPNSKRIALSILYYGGVVIALAFMLIKVYDLGGINITSGPNLQILDSNHLAITWTTDKNSTSFVEYGSNKANLKRAYASVDGLISGNSETHKVIIPYPKNSSIVYRVLSTKINHYYQNNLEYGNTAASDFKKFTDPSHNSTLTFYIFNDVHENVRLYKHFLADKNYDFVFLNGDAINSSDTTSEIVNKMLKPLSAATNGEKPFYYIRGNHETRGGAARELPNYLALPDNHYYYTFNIGPIFGVVLDSGEDKLDNHEEYSGLVDFNSYRDQETKWLQKVYESASYKNAKYRIAFVHIPLNFNDNNLGNSYLKTYQKNWRELLNKMNMDVVFSGHTHVPEVIKPEPTKFLYPTIIGGGPTENQRKYLAVKAEVTSDKMSIFFVNYYGQQEKLYEIESRH